MGRKERLNEVYEYVRNHFPIHTQVDFAEKLKYHRTYISSAMHGNERNLTDKLFTNICEVFPDTFNLDYLLTGKGALLSDGENAHEEKQEDKATENLLEIYARMIRGVDDLRVQLMAELEDIKEAKAALQQEREELKNITYRLTQALAQMQNNAPTSLPIAAENGIN